jgi:hypothetical protein
VNHKYGSFESAARALGGSGSTPQSVLSPLTISDTARATAAPQSVLSSVSGGGLGGSGDVVQGIQQLASTLGQTSNAQQATVNGLLENTRALTDNTSAVDVTKSSALTTAGNAASSFLGGGISPLLTGLFSLLGLGSQSQTVTPELRYAAPASVKLSGAVGGGGTSGGGTSGGGTTQAVNIQVNAMDSKSFLDHSEDIAQAVRQAILNSSSLNDAIAGL